MIHLTTILRTRPALKGQGLTEYALIIALVAIVAVTALTLLGGQLGTIFGDVNTALGG